MFDRAIKVEDFQHFKAHLHGELICPGDDGYECLARVKNAYDPTNFFHLNHNIKPSAER